MCYDGDASVVFQEKRVRARKDHTCDECGSPIPKGAEYIRVSGLDEPGGSWFGGAQHVECWALWHFVQRELCGGVGLILLGGLHEEIREYSEPELDDEGEVIPGPTLRDIFEAIGEGYERQAAA